MVSEVKDWKNKQASIFEAGRKTIKIAQMQASTHAITQAFIKAVKAVVKAMSEATEANVSTRQKCSNQHGTHQGRTKLKEPTFDRYSKEWVNRIKKPLKWRETFTSFIAIK